MRLGEIYWKSRNRTEKCSIADSFSVSFLTVENRRFFREFVS